jgi:hypothetical protein
MIVETRSAQSSCEWRRSPKALFTWQQQLKGFDMATQDVVKGPASYFPSIEKKYGKPVAHWMQILKQAGPLKHMELVNQLKTDHQLGHGHANALVAWFLAKK